MKMYTNTNEVNEKEIICIKYIKGIINIWVKRKHKVYDDILWLKDMIFFLCDGFSYQ